MSTNAPWYDALRAKLGQREVPGSGTNPWIAECFAAAGHPGVRDDGVPWCAAAMAWALKEAGYANTGSLAARSYLTYGRKLDKPIRGCIVVFWRGSPASWEGHVATYERDAGDKIVVVGGNQSNAVTEAAYTKSQVLGYRWPGDPIAAPGLSEGTIRGAQQRLAALGYPVGMVDGEAGPRTRMAVRAYQETAGLEVTGVLDADTLASLRRPGAHPMPVGEARANATAAEVSAAGSTTIKAANILEAGTAAATAGATGNALAEAGTALTEAGKVVATVDTGRKLGTQGGDILAWMFTLRGALTIGAVVLCIGTWAGIRYIKARRVAAHRAGRQA